MSWITATDPLALVAIASGQVNTPAIEQGASGTGSLDTQQRAVAIGEPVPIVFARRRNSSGGIFISPGATEARFENDTNNAVTAYYHLVISEGQVDSIPVKDVFQRSCRVGTHTQTYNRRAGEWDPENAIVQRSGYTLPEAPYYCGTVGSYPDMSTLSFQTGLIPDGFDYWNRQVHLFIRGGMWVTRYEDNVLGPSDSLADLAKWLMINSSRLSADLVDDDALETADLFLRANGYTCNCELKESRNYEDLIADWSKYFLLAPSNNAGKRGLRPLLPITAAGLIDTTPIVPVYGFTENTIIPGSFEISYVSLADRLPFVAQMTWRQQLEDDFGIIRTIDVRFQNTAGAGPYESHDLSEFCTSEKHAAQAGAYIVAKRVYTTHTAKFTAKPGDHSTLISPGDIVRVRLQRNASTFEFGYHDYLYQVERITNTLAGDVTYELTHFPVDDLGRSLIALAVSETTGSGILFTSNRTGLSCDINSSTDDTIPDEEFTLPDFDSPEYSDFDLSVPSLEEGLDGDGSLESSAANNSSVPNDGGIPGGEISVGDELELGVDPGDGCAVTFAWYSVDPESGATILRKSETFLPGGNISETNYIVDEEDEGLEIYSTYFETCPGDDEESEITTTNHGTVEPAPPYNRFKYFRFNGTAKTNKGQTITILTSWYPTATYYGAIAYPACSTAGGAVPCGSAIPWKGNVRYTAINNQGGITCVYGNLLRIFAYNKTNGAYAGTMFKAYVAGCSNGPDGGFLGSIEGQWDFTDNRIAPAESWPGT